MLLPKIRKAEDGDAQGIIFLIRQAYYEYPHCILDVEGEEPELLSVATTFEGKGGRFWVATEEQTIVGCVAWVPGGQSNHGAVAGSELKKFYVKKSHRRLGLGSLLLDKVQRSAQKVGDRSLVLWTDLRFVEAHAFYRARGFVETGRTRLLHDVSNTTELEFTRPV